MKNTKVYSYLILDQIALKDKHFSDYEFICSQNAYS